MAALAPHGEAGRARGDVCRPARRRAGALAAAVALGAGLACRGPAALAPRPQPLGNAPASGSAAEPGPSALDLALLEALRQAFEDGDDTLAWSLHERLAAATTDSRVRAVVDDYRRRLEGRALLKQLDLGLQCRPTADGRGTAVWFVAHNRSATELTVQFLPATLERRCVVLSPLGLESRSREDSLVPELPEFRVGAQASFEMELRQFPVPMAGALACREWYQFSPSGAWLLVGGELLPARDLRVRGDDRTCLAGYLPGTAVDPAAVADYLDEPRAVTLPEEVFTPALLERAVRVPAADRARAVALLAERAAQWSDEQLTAGAPAFRWLTGALAPGGDPRAWRGHFAALRAQAEPLAARPESDPSLVLPR
jgi:hypothetical protein